MEGEKGVEVKGVCVSGGCTVVTTPPKVLGVNVNGVAAGQDNTITVSVLNPLSTPLTLSTFTLTLLSGPLRLGLARLPTTITLPSDTPTPLLLTLTPDAAFPAFYDDLFTFVDGSFKTDVSVTAGSVRAVGTSEVDAREVTWIGNDVTVVAGAVCGEGVCVVRREVPKIVGVTIAGVEENEQKTLRLTLESTSTIPPPSPPSLSPSTTTPSPSPPSSPPLSPFPSPPSLKPPPTISSSLLSTSPLSPPSTTPCLPMDWWG
ncbi:hypothetical protein BC829DRAFT_114023 [Chytridium lagenaria]|nr:hypothetical protein BC829DRAFT_114023 [Chytridium lagenaria]